MTYDFRIRATMVSSPRINADSNELALHESPPVRVTLRAARQDAAIKDCGALIVHGTGFASREEAHHQGEQWLDWVMAGFAAGLIGADFGVRAPITGGLSQASFDVMRQAIDAEGYGPVQLYNERSGMNVYPTEPPAHFSLVEARGVSPRSPEMVLDAIQTARAADLRLSETFRLAYDLFAASCSEFPADARFLMLSMALETMITQSEPSVEAQALLDQLITHVASSAPVLEAASITGHLRDLKRRESVNQAGRRLAATLSDGQRTYGGRDPQRFFRDVYRLRSDLVHGRYPRPDQQLISLEAAHLQRFVADLLVRGPE